MKKLRCKTDKVEAGQPERIQQLVSRKQVSRMGGCCIETIKRWEKKRILTPIKLSARMVRYDMAEVQRVFADARVAA